MADISVRLTQVNTSDPKLGRVNIEQVEPGRTAELRAGTSNFGVGNILIFDGSGNPDVISPEEEGGRDAGWDIKFTGGAGKEKIRSYALGAKDDKADESGDRVPFECIRVGGNTPGSAERTKFDVSHFAYVGPENGQGYFRMWRVTSDKVRHESDWVGAEDGSGFRFGRQ